MKPILAIAISIGTIYVWLSTVSTTSSLVRIGMHWLRGVPLLLLICPYDEASPSRFWRIYRGFEDTAAYIALSLAKFARKGDEGRLLIIPDTKAALDDALKTVGGDESSSTTATIEEAVEALKESEHKND